MSNLDCSQSNRRSFLLRSVLAPTAACVAGQSILATPLLGNPLESDSKTATTTANAGEATRLVPIDHPLMRVRIELDVKGNVLVPKNPLIKPSETRELPIESKAVLDYEERQRRAAESEGWDLVTERYYHAAESTSKLNKTSRHQTIRDSARQTVVHQKRLPATIYSPTTFLTHGELSLLKSPLNALASESLLPDQAVTAGDRYKIDVQHIAALLNWTTADSGSVECEVVSLDDRQAKLQFKGNVKGSVDSVETEIELLGKLLFDLEQGFCPWVALAVHEKRRSGQAEPGFDLAGTLRMIRQPMEKPVALASDPISIDTTAEPPADRLYVELQSAQLGCSAMMQRRWKMIQDRPGAAVLRMIEHEKSLSQCNLQMLPALPEGHQLTLEAFKTMVSRSVDGNLTQLVNGSERVSVQGLRILTVIADGETSGVPVRWIMMHFSDDQGKRIQATFTLPAAQIEAFAGSDAQFADSLRFLSEDQILDGKPPEMRENSATEPPGQANLQQNPSLKVLNPGPEPIKMGATKTGSDASISGDAAAKIGKASVQPPASAR